MEWLPLGIAIAVMAWVLWTMGGPDSDAPRRPANPDRIQREVPAAAGLVAGSWANHGSHHHTGIDSHGAPGGHDGDS